LFKLQLKNNNERDKKNVDVATIETTTGLYSVYIKMYLGKAFLSLENN